jgi:hypothetical protein
VAAVAGGGRDLPLGRGVADVEYQSPPGQQPAGRPAGGLETGPLPDPPAGPGCAQPLEIGGVLLGQVTPQVNRDHASSLGYLTIVDEWQNRQYAKGYCQQAVQGGVTPAR